MGLLSLFEIGVAIDETVGSIKTGAAIIKGATEENIGHGIIAARFADRGVRLKRKLDEAAKGKDKDKPGAIGLLAAAGDFILDDE